MEKKQQFDWQTSTKSFEIFKIIYKNSSEEKPTKIKDIVAKTGKSNGVISRQFGCFKNEGILIAKRVGNDKHFWIDKKKLEAIIGGSAFSVAVMALLEISLNFNNFVNIVKKFRAK